MESNASGRRESRRAIEVAYKKFALDSHDAVPSPLTDRRRAAARAIALTTLTALLLLAARRLDTLPDGLRGQYFPNIDWSGDPAKTVVDPTPSTDALLRASAGTPALAFSVAW